MKVDAFKVAKEAQLKHIIKNKGKLSIGKMVSMYVLDMVEDIKGHNQQTNSLMELDTKIKAAAKKDIVTFSVSLSDFFKLK